MYNSRAAGVGAGHKGGANGTPGVVPARPVVVNEPRPVSLPRRLGAILYDSLLLVAVLFAAGLPLPLIPESARSLTWVRYGTFCYMILVGFAFFGWFWTHGGQTLGMRAWKFRVVTEQLEPLTWKLALLRFVWSLASWVALGFGFLWSLADRRSRTWHDLFSGTRLARVSRDSLPPQREQSDDEQHRDG